MSEVLLVTGTDTEVGKTAATAALAVALAARGPVRVHKAVQTGVAAGESGDAGEVEALTAGLDVVCSEGVRCTLPMAPVAAAAADGVALPPLEAHARAVAALAEQGQVIVEGSGGLLVGLDGRGRTLADLPAALAGLGLRSRTVVVVRPDLGTLNHTALTLEALERRGAEIAGLVIGSWPAEPGLVQRSNREALAGLGVPLLGALPAGAPARSPGDFQALVRGLRLLG